MMKIQQQHEDQISEYQTINYLKERSIHNMKQNLTLFKHPSNHQTELLQKSVTDQPKQRSDWNLISKVIMIFDFLASIYCTVQVKKHQLHTCMTTNGILQVIQSSNFKFT